MPLAPAFKVTAMSEITLNQEQESALGTVLLKIENGQEVVSLSGAAGTGKTTILKSLVEDLENAGRSCTVVTPTNKAATVLQKKGVKAATYFKVFFVVDESDLPNLRFVPACDWAGELSDGKKAFSDIIILDEGSMLGSWGLRHLRRMCNTLVLVGDGNQLAPVGDRDNPRGYFCQRSHDAHLEKVMRNDGKILQLATTVRKSSTGFDLKGMDLDDFYPEDDFETTIILDRPQFISFKNVTRQQVNHRVRKVLGFIGTLPQEGDLMVCRSNYNDVLLNGTQATVVSFEWDGESPSALARLAVDDQPEQRAKLDMVAFFKDQPIARAEHFLDKLRGQKLPEDEAFLTITFGYCVTAHTAQGGEWPAVCVVDERQTVKAVAAREFGDNPAAMPPGDAVRRWFYTAVTRAQADLFVVNDGWTKS
jgi:exodeoxyribonuclease V